MQRVLVVLAVIAVALASFASAGVAGNSVVTGHSATPPAAGNLGKQAAPPLTSSAHSGALPFTGLDLAGISIGGVLLVGAGLALRRMPRRRL